MEKIIAAVLVLASLLAIGHASLLYKRSFYLESVDRINLEKLTDNIDQLERHKLIELTKRLVIISRSDTGIMMILNDEFRQALFWLIACLGLSLVLLGWLLLKPYLLQRLEL